MISITINTLFRWIWASCIIISYTLAIYGKPIDLWHDAMKLYKKGHYTSAVNTFQKFIDKNSFLPQVEQTFYYIAESYFAMGQYSKAIRYYNIFKQRYKKSEYKRDIWYKLGICYYEIGVFSKANKLLQAYHKKVHVIQPNQTQKARLYTTMGHLAKQDKLFHASNQYFHRALSLWESLNKKSRSARKTKVINDIYYELSMLSLNVFKHNEIAYKYLQKAIGTNKAKKNSFKYLIRKLSLVHINNQNGLPSNLIADIQVDNDDVWVATWNNGLVRFTRSQHIFTPIKLPSSNIRNLYIDFNTIYICTYDGILIYDKRNAKSRHLKIFNRHIPLAQQVMKDDRYLYFTTLSQGVIRFDTIKQEVVRFNHNSFLRSNYIYTMTANHKYLIFGTVDKGVVIYNKKGKKVSRIDKNTLGGNNIKSVLIDGRFLWIGVNNHGIYRYDFNLRKVRHNPVGVTFPSQIVKRDHEIWIASLGSGIYIFNQKDGTTQHMTAINGLTSNDVQLIRIEGHYIWIGYLDAGIDILYRPLND